jgi:flagellar basal body-associated protein FliL
MGIFPVKIFMLLIYTVLLLISLICLFFIHFNNSSRKPGLKSGTISGIPRAQTKQDYNNGDSLPIYILVEILLEILFEAANIMLSWRSY